jgi:site-specific DNA recombinase
MITTNFNPDLPLRYVRYGRMSDEEQNPRSPEQQFDDIDRTKRKQRRDNWVHVKDFRDDAISGRYNRKRPGFRQMLDAIRSGLLKIDAILVDTIERFARLEDLPAIRDELRRKYGVLILTSDTGFADPTSTVGRIYGAMESIRASSAASQKAHDVLRGKIDVVMMKRWPGGPPNCGYRLADRRRSFVQLQKAEEGTNPALMPRDGGRCHSAHFAQVGNEDLNLLLRS